MPAIILLAVEPDERFWQSLQAELSRDPRFGLSYRTPDAEKAVGALQTIRPTMLMADMTMPDFATMDLIHRVGGAQPAAGIVALAESLDDTRVSFALAAGASACLARSAPARQVAGAMLEVASGAMPIHREVAGRPALLIKLITDFQRGLRGSKASSAPCPLTQRELAVLDMVAGGNANKEIGASLSISERTVKNHMTNILVKLTARDRAHAVRIGMEHSWIGQHAWRSPLAAKVAA